MNQGRKRVPAETKPHEAVLVNTLQSESAKQNANLTWIEFEPGTSSDRRSSNKLARRHAAFASAATRKATIARRQHQQNQQDQIHSTMIIHPPKKETRGPKTESDRKKAGSLEKSRLESRSPDLVVYISSLLGGLWSTVERPDLAYKAIRTKLWDAFTNSSTLFQSALFVAGTHANTCGVPPSDLKPHFGTGLILLRGASLNAIQAAVIAANGDSLTSIAIALLAGWERRYGDRESYEVHIQAWKALSLPREALEADNITRLTELSFESFRERLNERALTGSEALSLRSNDDYGRLRGGLPSGFRVFQAVRPEARSVLHLVDHFINEDLYAPDGPAVFRRLGLEAMAWGPSHSLGIEPSPADEATWDQMELNALYHVRSALISAAGVLLQTTLDIHHEKSAMDLQAGLDVHTTACQHLRSEELMGTKYQEVALWTRFTLCAMSPFALFPGRDELLKSYLMRQGIETWEQLRSILERHLYLGMSDTKYHSLYRHLTENSPVRDESHGPVALYRSYT